MARLDIGAHAVSGRAFVEERLIAAFRAMPSCPVYGFGNRVRTTEHGRNELTDILNWAALLDRDPDARKYLWTWARCRATNQSFGEICHEMGWKRPTAEVGRRRGALAIARTLEAAQET